MSNHEQPSLFPETSNQPKDSASNVARDYTSTEVSDRYRPRYPEAINMNAGEIINEMTHEFLERRDRHEDEQSSFYDLGFTDPEEPVVSKTELLTKLREAGELKIYNDILNNRLGNLFVRLDHLETEVLRDRGLEEDESRQQEIEDFNEAAQKHGLPSAYSFIQLAYLMENFPEH